MLRFWLALSLFASLDSAAFAGEDITWLIDYDGTSQKEPREPAWKIIGTPRFTPGLEGLSIRDDPDTGDGSFRAAWKADPDLEVIVEATVRMGAMTGTFKTEVWPWRDGAPVCLHVSNGKFQDGLVFYPNRINTFTDRFYMVDADKGFHTYRLSIRGNDMSVAVDGKVVIQGEGAFWKPASSPDAFLQIGSNSKKATGDAVWKNVKLGVRKATKAAEAPKLTVTISPPWPITRADKVRQSRPYVYNLGQDLLLMSVAQGPDALYEPYGVLKSTDGGKTWTPIPGLDQTQKAPLPLVRLKDGSILGASRWVWPNDDGTYSAKTVKLDSKAEKFEMYDSKVNIPKGMLSPGKGNVAIFERHIWANDDGSISVIVWTRNREEFAPKLQTAMRRSHLFRSTDLGKNWDYVSTVAPGGEPAVVKLTETEWTAITRPTAVEPRLQAKLVPQLGADPAKITTLAGIMPMVQAFSHDGGKTWSDPAILEEGRVAPDLALMSNGVLACSYGRPVSSVMFSLDKGKTWSTHKCVSEKAGFNYSGIVEVKPGRLLYLHDGGGLQGVYIDVEKVK